MSRNTPTIVVTDTDQISAIADAIIAKAGNPALTKNTVLNLIAGGLLGPKTNWGGLKARPSPVRATPLAQTSSQAPSQEFSFVLPVSNPAETGRDTLPRRTAGVQSTYWLDRDALVIRFAAENTGTSNPWFQTEVRMIELPMLERALETHGRYGAETATFEVDGAQLRITHQVLGGIERADFDLAEFREFLRIRRERIEKDILNKGVGESILDAFISVAEGQGEDILFEVAEELPAIEEKIHEEGAEANSRRIDAACRAASMTFIAEAALHPARRSDLLENTWRSAVDAVFDAEWQLLAQVMRESLEAEAST